MGTVMRPLARLEPVQQNLPLPPPPWRPFFALAREVPVGNPTSKYVYLVLASYCPIMARAWSAVGRVRRTTLQRVCEFKKIQTLDLHLRALRDAGYADWSRTGRASEFVIRLSPLHILGSLAQPGSTSDGVSDQPPRGLDPPSSGGSGRRPFTSNGHSAPGSGADPPFDGESATSFGDSESPPDGVLCFASRCRRFAAEGGISYSACRQVQIPRFPSRCSARRISRCWCSSSCCCC